MSRVSKAYPICSVIFQSFKESSNPKLARSQSSYGVATISRLLKIIYLFCKRDLLKRQFSAKKTCNFKEPTTRSHPVELFKIKTWQKRPTTFIFELCNSFDKCNWRWDRLIKRIEVESMFCKGVEKRTD